MATNSVDGITPSGQNAGPPPPPPPIGGGISGAPNQGPLDSDNENSNGPSSQRIQKAWEALKESGPVYPDARNQAQADQRILEQARVGYELFKLISTGARKPFSASDFIKFVQENRRQIQAQVEKQKNQNVSFTGQYRGGRALKFLQKLDLKLPRGYGLLGETPEEREEAARAQKTEAVARSNVDAVSRKPAKPAKPAEEKAEPVLHGRQKGQRDRVIEPLVAELKKHRQTFSDTGQQELSDLKLRHEVELAYQAYIWLDKNYSHPSQHELHQFYIQHRRDIEKLRHVLEPELKQGRFPQKMLEKHAAEELFRTHNLFGLKHGDEKEGKGGKGAGPGGPGEQGAVGGQAGAAVGPAGFMMEAMDSAFKDVLGFKSSEERAKAEAAKAKTEASISPGGSVSGATQATAAGDEEGGIERNIRVSKQAGRGEAEVESEISAEVESQMSPSSGAQPQGGEISGEAEVEAEVSGQVPSGQEEQAGGPAKIEVEAQTRTEEAPQAAIPESEGSAEAGAADGQQPAGKAAVEVEAKVSGQVPSGQEEQAGGPAKIEVEAQTRTEEAPQAAIPESEGSAEAGAADGQQPAGKAAAEVKVEVSATERKSQPAQAAQPASIKVEGEQKIGQKKPEKQGRAEPQEGRVGGEIDVKIRRKVKLSGKLKTKDKSAKGPSGAGAQPSVSVGGQQPQEPEPGGKGARAPQASPKPAAGEKTPPGKKGDAMLPQAAPGEPATGQRPQAGQKQAEPEPEVSEAPVQTPKDASQAGPEQPQAEQKPVAGEEAQEQPQEAGEAEPTAAEPQKPAPQEAGARPEEAKGPVASGEQRPSQETGQPGQEQPSGPEEAAVAPEPEKAAVPPAAGPAEGKEAGKPQPEGEAKQPSETPQEAQAPESGPEAPQEAGAPSQEPQAEAAPPVGPEKQEEESPTKHAGQTPQGGASQEKPPTAPAKAAPEAESGGGGKLAQAQQIANVAKAVKEGGLKGGEEAAVKAAAQIGADKAFYYLLGFLVSPFFLLVPLGLDILWALAKLLKVQLAFWQKAVIVVLNLALIAIIFFVIMIIVVSFCQQPLIKVLTTVGDFVGVNKQYTFCVDVNKFIDNVGKGGTGDFGGGGATSDYGGPIDTGKWKNDINAASQKYNIDPCILDTILKKESSGGDPNAIGHDNHDRSSDPFQRSSPPLYGLNWQYSHGLGITQVTIFPSGYRGTWPVWPDNRPVRISWGRNYYVEDLLNPQTSIDWTGHYVKDLSGQLGGDIRSVFRAYNGSGPKAEAYADDAMRLYNICKSQK